MSHFKVTLRSAALSLLTILLLSGCSQIEFGSHLFKVWEGPEDTGGPVYDSYTRTYRTTPQTQGTFKVGKPYSVLGTTYYPTETYNYVETGIASWYGPGFHGKKTASGETYNQNELTAAHRTLQMPSLVRVTNLTNGRSVVVRVNDRGPFAKGRIIDVSGAAAKLLNMTGPGVARVKLELLASESRALAAAAKSGKSTQGVEVAYNRTGQLPGSYGYQAPTGPVISDIKPTEEEITQYAKAGDVSGHMQNGRFYPNPVVEQQAVTKTNLYVQAGAFGVEENARRLSEKLSAYGASSLEPVSYGGRTLYKVRLGPLDSIGAADRLLSKVLASGQSDAMIIVQ